MLCLEWGIRACVRACMCMAIEQIETANLNVALTHSDVLVIYSVVFHLQISPVRLSRVIMGEHANT